jgi:hypothetical protein
MHIPKPTNPFTLLRPLIRLHTQLHVHSFYLSFGISGDFVYDVEKHTLLFCNRERHTTLLYLFQGLSSRNMIVVVPFSPKNITGPFQRRHE